MAERNINDKILEKVNSDRRSFLKRVLKASFAMPVIATFSIEALSIDSANAEVNVCNAYSNTTALSSTGIGPILPDIDNAPYCTEFLFDSPFK